MSTRNGWVLGLGITLATTGMAQAQANRPVPVFVNGARLDSEALLLQHLGRTVLPMRTLFESLGARVEWDAQQQAVYAWKPDGTGVRLALGSGNAQSLLMSDAPGPGNWGRVVANQRLDAPPMMMGSRIYVPLRFASEALKADVRYASYEPAVHIKTETVAGYRDVEPPVAVRPRELDPPVVERRIEPPVVERRESVEVEEYTTQERLRDRRTGRGRPLVLEGDRVVERRRARDLERVRDREIDLRPAEIAAALDVSLTVRKERFDRGETIPMRLVIRNHSARTLSLPFRSGQQFDFQVLQEGRVIWNWANERSFTQALTTLTLKPDEEVVFSVRWNQETNSGRRINPGRYTVRGILASDLRGQEVLSEQTITISR